MQAHNEIPHGGIPQGLPGRDAVGGYGAGSPGTPGAAAVPAGPGAPGHQDAGPLVRPYVIAQGREHADTVRLDMISVVIAAKRAEVDEMALEPEQLRILELCRRPQSVAEVSAHLDIPVAVVKVLLSDLLNRGLALARAPYTAKSPVSRDVLQAVLDGIQRL
ncbi:DUF742 domain-containing protein [Nocardiopsis tropica]|uniref:DUF742 domain-containing protein n=1 Tax=Nocardiopsis tropica TaxID=109330 RepID=A0ABU7KYY1_9ACTN|nr:DUF742 domain-containing protein [Nocardiopsis umidischolae]MEE2054499.1 DUF742 domain-containing protein [Nocardiopsis umidischolae]